MHKKLIALCLVCSVVGSSTIAFATTNTNSTLNNKTSIQDTTSTTTAVTPIKTNTLSQSSIDKVDKYIVVENNKFV